MIFTMIKRLICLPALVILLAVGTARAGTYELVFEDGKKAAVELPAKWTGGPGEGCIIYEGRIKMCGDTARPGGMTTCEWLQGAARFIDSPRDNDVAISTVPLDVETLAGGGAKAACRGRIIAPRLKSDYYRIVYRVDDTIYTLVTQPIIWNKDMDSYSITGLESDVTVIATGLAFEGSANYSKISAGIIPAPEAPKVIAAAPVPEKPEVEAETQPAPAVETPEAQPETPQEPAAAKEPAVEEPVATVEETPVVAEPAPVVEETPVPAVVESSPSEQPAARMEEPVPAEPVEAPVAAAAVPEAPAQPEPVPAEPEPAAAMAPAEQETPAQPEPVDISVGDLLNGASLGAGPDSTVEPAPEARPEQPAPAAAPVEPATPEPAPEAPAVVSEPATPEPAPSEPETEPATPVSREAEVVATPQPVEAAAVAVSAPEPVVEPAPAPVAQPAPAPVAPEPAVARAAPAAKTAAAPEMILQQQKDRPNFKDIQARVDREGTGWIFERSEFIEDAYRKLMTYKLEGAEKDFRKLEAPFPYDAAVGLGDTALAKRDIVSARKFYAAARELDPSKTDASVGLGAVDLMSGNLVDAEKKFIDAYKMDPNNPSVLTNLGMLAMQTGHFPDAEKNFYEALARKPSLDVAVAAVNGLTEVWLRYGEYKAIKEWNENLLREFPESPDGHANLLMAHLLLGNDAAAAKELDYIKKSVPDEFHRMVLGQAYFKAGKYEQAGMYLCSVRSGNVSVPMSSEEHALCSVCLGELGDSSGALANLEKACARPDATPEVYIMYAKELETRGKTAEARRVLYLASINFPGNILVEKEKERMGE